MGDEYRVGSLGWKQKLTLRCMLEGEGDDVLDLGEGEETFSLQEAFGDSHFDPTKVFPSVPIALGQELWMKLGPAEKVSIPGFVKFWRA